MQNILTAEKNQEAVAKSKATGSRKSPSFVPSKLTYAGSNMFRAGVRTETSILDAAIAVATEAKIGRAHVCTPVTQ